MINLLPYKEKKDIEKIHSLRLVRLIVIGFIIIAALSFILLIPTMMTINSRFSIANNQINDLKQNGSIISDIDLASLQKRALNAQSKLAINIPTSPDDQINLVKSLALSDIKIDRFGTTDNTGELEVSGIAGSRESLQRFVVILEQNSTISSVQNPVSNFIKSHSGAFKLFITFK